MAQADKSLGSVRFGPFELLLDTQELRKNGVPVKLFGQPIQVLIVLSGRPGSLVTREELQQKLWPADSFGDFKHGLNAAINKLREKLGDSATTPTYIETLPGRGYRFIAEVRTPDELRSPDEQHDLHLVEPQEPAPPKLTPAAAWRSSWKRKTTIVVATCAVVLSLYWLLRSTTSGIRPHRRNWQIESVSALAGLQGDASFSPDGNSIAFCYSEEQTYQQNEAPYPDIYVKVIGDEKMLRLTNPPGVSFAPAWSPDGRAIAYWHGFEESPGKFTAEIMLMTPLGGSKRIVRRVGAPRKVAWSPDGKLLAYEND